MKKLLLMVCVMAMAVSTSAKKVVLKAGTVVPMQAVKAVKAADVQEGQTVDFSVTSNIAVDGTVVIPQGTLVKGKVSLAKKSFIAGTKGKLNIDITDITLQSGQRVFLSNTGVKICGQNRTPVAVITGLLIWPLIFLPGSRAEMAGGYEVQGTISSNVEIDL